MKTSSLQFKVILIVAGAMVLSVAVSVVALTRVNGSVQDLDRISREDFESQLSIVSTAVALKTHGLRWKDMMLRAKTPAAVNEHWSELVAVEKSTGDYAREARGSTPHEDVRKRMDAFLTAHRAAGEKYRQALEAFKASKFDAIAADDLVAGLDRGLAVQLEEAEAVAQEKGSKAMMASVKSGELAYRIAIAAVILAMLAAIVAVWIVFRRAVLRPIGTAVVHAERIAQGDLTGDIRSTSKDEAGQLLTALARMNAGLSEVVSQVRAAAESVVTASGQVAMGTTDLSQRTEEQASSLEETAASMEELSSTVKQNADNARKADELARGASKRAERGGSEVVRVVVTMNEISDSAAKIADIISVIDAIAFQTNILALNAAVEAARAGEQGRGFAVVAAEVRSLAQRSAQAAKEIKALIGDSVAKAKEGTSLVEQAGDTIQALVIDVKQVSELMGSIAEASAEQSRGVQQVNKTVTEMDKVVQQNAAAVQQSASAAEAMRRQAEALVKAVSAFRLGGTAAKAVPSARAQAGRSPAVLTHARPSNTLLAKKPAAATGSVPGAAVSPSEEWEEF
jgi:methyl-accepting chemotaxis protein-1 (serine sensor receptor)